MHPTTLERITYPDQLMTLLPERLKPYVDTIETTKFGKLTLSTAPFAEPVTNEDLLNNVPPEQRAAAWESIKSTGINTRYFGHLDHPTHEVMVTEAASASALLIHNAIQGEKWPAFDHLVMTSAFLPEEVASKTLTRGGYDPQRVTFESNRLACSGAVTAFIDALARPGLKDKRVVIVAAEPLSALFDNHHFTAQHVIIPAIFGDDYAALAFRPADYTLIAAKTVVIPDGGIIRLRTWYDLPEHDEERTLSHYEFAAGGREVTSISRRGTFMRQTEPETDISTSMNGIATAKFFIKHTPPVIAAVLAEAARQNIRPRVAIVHQPSQPVVEGIGRVMNRLIPDDRSLNLFYLTYSVLIVVQQPHS